MKQQIKKQVFSFIKSLKESDIFSIADIKIANAKRTTIYYALNEALNDGLIDKLARGKYYIPKKTRFGNIKPKDSDVIEHVIKEVYKKTKIKPYFASNTIFLKLGLTTQVSSEIFIICNISANKKIYIKNLKINMIKYKEEWKPEQTKYLEFLYSLDHINKIPDASIDESYIILFKILKSNFDTNGIIGLSKSLNYFKPKTAALLGSMIEQLGYKILADEIYNNLNKTTSYNFNVKDTTINKELKKKWRIK